MRNTVFFVLLAACAASDDSSPRPKPPDTPDPAHGCSQLASEIQADQISAVTLVLDGNGTRCEQVVRAILDPAQQPPELADVYFDGLDLDHCDELPFATSVGFVQRRMRGGPLVRAKSFHLAVDPQTNELTGSTGSFIVATSGPPFECAFDEQVARDAVVGHVEPYLSGQTCDGATAATWTIAAEDQRVIASSAWLFDGTRLIDVRDVEVTVADARVTPELAEGDLSCCEGTDTHACIGKHFFVDADGAILDQQFRCTIDVCAD